VDEDYQEAIVVTPNRKYLCLRARTSTIREPRYEALVAKADQPCIDTLRLLKHPQREAIKAQRT
jgi:lipocalin